MSNLSKRLKSCWLWRLLCAIGAGFLAFWGLAEVPDDVVRKE